MIDDDGDDCKTVKKLLEWMNSWNSTIHFYKKIY